MNTFNAFIAIANIVVLILHMHNARVETQLGLSPAGSLVGIGLAAMLATYFGTAAFH